jgi:hypothetical protein
MIDEQQIHDVISEVMDDFFDGDGSVNMTKYDRNDFQECLAKAMIKAMTEKKENVEDIPYVAFDSPHFDLCDESDPITMKFLQEMRNE